MQSFMKGKVSSNKLYEGRHDCLAIYEEIVHHFVSFHPIPSKFPLSLLSVFKIARCRFNEYF
jgi:hypothetical protein